MKMPTNPKRSATSTSTSTKLGLLEERLELHNTRISFLEEVTTILAELVAKGGGENAPELLVKVLSRLAILKQHQEELPW